MGNKVIVSLEWFMAWFLNHLIDTIGASKLESRHKRSRCESDDSQNLRRIGETPKFKK